MEENQNMNNDQTNQGVDTPATQPAQVGRPTESDTQKLDVLLQDPKIQAEFDKN